MTALTLQQASVQLARTRNNGMAVKLNAGAVGNNLPIPFVYAICSRETNCINELGDYHDGEYHGVGIMQIDVGTWPLARTMRDDKSWQDQPERLIAIGCQLLASNLEAVRQEWPTLEASQQQHIAACGYNAGIVRAIKQVRAGRDADSITTGHDYGADVMARMGLFEQLLADQTTP